MTEEDNLVYPTYTSTRRSVHCDRIRAAVVALEGWDRYRTLCTAPVEEFHMNQWRCGTSACAAGYLGLLKPFRKKGLMTTRDGIRVLEHEYGSPVVGLAEFFDVEYGVSASWFLYGARTPQDVADKMRAYLRVHGEETGTVAPRKADRRPHFLSGTVRG